MIRNMFIIYVLFVLLKLNVFLYTFRVGFVVCLSIFCMTTYLTSKEKLQNPVLVLLLLRNIPTAPIYYIYNSSSSYS